MWAAIVSLLNTMLSWFTGWRSGRNSAKQEATENDNKILKRQLDVTVTTIDAARKLRKRIEDFYK